MAAEAHRIHFSAYYCIYLALMLLILPLRWLVAMLLAATVHELCHWLAICLLGKGWTWLHLGVGGAKMSLPEMVRGQELFCALAGPIGSMCLLLLVEIFPRLAICGAIQGIYNLLPIYPLDGGRAVRCFLQICFSPPTAKRLIHIMDIGFDVLLLILGFCGTFVYRLGLFPILLSFLILLRGKSGKIPCKPDRFRVQ